MHSQIQGKSLKLPQVPMRSHSHSNCPVYRNSVAALDTLSRTLTGCFGLCQFSAKVPVIESTEFTQQGVTLCT